MKTFKYFQQFTDWVLDLKWTGAGLSGKTLPFEKWDQLLKEGKASSVKAEISSWNLSKVDRDNVENLSRYAHRLNLPQVVLRLLNPIVRSDKPLEEPARSGELAEYAMALNRVGASDEASEVLDAIADAEFSNLWLYKAFANMTQWNYSKAGTCLRRHLKRVEKDSKAATVAKVNLAASYIFLEESDKARDLLSEIIDRTKIENMLVLYGNANELMAQVHLQKKNLPKASEHLDIAEKALQGTHGLGPFFVEKWQVILKAQQESDPAVGFQMIEELKQKARRIRHWETVRDCEFIQSDLSVQNDFALKLYYGTPFKEYRKRLKNRFGLKVNWRHHYDYQLPGTNSSQPVLLDVAEGRSMSCGFELNPGGVLHQLLFQFTRDFYRPMTLGSIFARLYPDEYFDPNTSFDRAFKSVQRLRAEFSQRALPLKILENSGGYQLLGDDVTLRVRLKENLASKECLELIRLKSVFDGQAKKLSEVAQLSGFSESKLRGIFSHPDNKKKVAKLGSGPGTRYKLVS